MAPLADTYRTIGLSVSLLDTVSTRKNAGSPIEACKQLIRLPQHFLNLFRNRCFGRNAVFVLRLESEQGFAILVAAQRENREDETSAVLGSE